MFCEKEAEEGQHEYEYLSVFYKVLGYLTSNFIKKAKTDAGMVNAAEISDADIAD